MEYTENEKLQGYFDVHLAQEVCTGELSGEMIERYLSFLDLMGYCTKNMRDALDGYEVEKSD